MTNRRELLVRLCAALWGFAIAIALLPLWERPAPPTQPPGYMKSLGINANASFRFTLALIVVPMLVVWAMRGASALLARDDTRAWARNTFCGACALAMWFVLLERSLMVVVVLPLAALIGVIVLRRYDARFSRGDMILIPTIMAVYIALMDVMPKAVHVVFLTAIVLVVIVRVAVRGYLAFTFAPLALALQTHFLSYHQRHMAWPQLAVALGTPLVMRALLRDSAATRRRLRFAIAFVVYPIASYGYLSATSLLAAEGLPHADLFEDSHNLLAASQMLHGEKPYRDIIPSHGLIHDGLLPYAALRTGDVDLGRALKVRGVIGGLNVIGNYALAAAATGSPEVGIATVFLGMMMGTGGGTARVLPALVTLVLIAAALRKRDPRWLAAAGVVVVIAILNSLDFGLFSLVITLIAALRFRAGPHPPLRGTLSRIAGEGRGEGLLYTAIGGVAAAIVAFIILGIWGIAGDFVRVTLFEIAPLGSVYALNPWTTPPALQNHHIPEVLSAIFDKGVYLFVVWAIVAVAVAVALLRRGGNARRRARDEAILIIAVFVLVCGFSYAERHHLYWQFVAAPLIATAIFRLSRSGLRALTPAAIVAALMIGQPTQHIAIAGGLRLVHGTIDPGWHELGLRRAQGALISDRDAAVIDAVARYAQPRLAEGETFFDFSNRNLLYFLLDRDCPIRQPEVAFYETEPLQREVIARLDANPRVRFAIVAAGADAASVDGIPNSARAPLVWEYIRQHFALDHEEAGLQFWYRK